MSAEKRPETGARFTTCIEPLKFEKVIDRRTERGRQTPRHTEPKKGTCTKGSEGL